MFSRAPPAPNNPCNGFIIIGKWAYLKSCVTFCSVTALLLALLACSPCPSYSLLILCLLLAYQVAAESCYRLLSASLAGMVSSSYYSWRCCLIAEQTNSNWVVSDATCGVGSVGSLQAAMGAHGTSIVGNTPSFTAFADEFTSG